MKKIKFFTFVEKDGCKQAEQKTGWTDGTYIYYYTYKKCNHKKLYGDDICLFTLPAHEIAITRIPILKK